MISYIYLLQETELSILSNKIIDYFIRLFVRWFFSNNIIFIRQSTHYFYVPGLLFWVLVDFFLKITFIWFLNMKTNISTIKMMWWYSGIISGIVLRSLNKVQTVCVWLAENIMFLFIWSFKSGMDLEKIHQPKRKQ